MAAPLVFVSYSYDNPSHVTWVLKLATDLREKGVDAILDTWDLLVGQDLAAFMEDGVSRSDRVVLVCSDAYVDKANAGVGGVGYEKMIVTRELVSSLSTDKFIPVLRENRKKATPTCLGTRRYLDFTEDAGYAAQLEDLLRTIHNAPRFAKPSLGPNPFASATSVASPASTPSASAVPAGTLSAPSAPAPTNSAPAIPPRGVFSDAWFLHAQASGLHKVQAFGTATMEVAFGLRQLGHDKDQRALLEAVRNAEVHTFGWPIGVVLDQSGQRPTPTNDGIIAEVEHAGFSDTSQMDYWHLRKNGDFYLAQNLFEDRKDKTAIFFNTQIVRVAESVLFCRNLLQNLQHKNGSEVEFRVRYAGIKGRRLSTSNPNRSLGVSPRVASVDTVETPVVFAHPATDGEVVAITKQLLDPLFILFDFFELRESVYEQIVMDFIGGRVT